MVGEFLDSTYNIQNFTPFSTIFYRSFENMEGLIGLYIVAQLGFIMRHNIIL